MVHTGAGIYPIILLTNEPADYILSAVYDIRLMEAGFRDIY